MILFDFNHNSDISGWNVVDDIVMGGRSNSRFFLNEKGNAEFTGSISLENNGGFSSVRYRFTEKDISEFDKFVIRLKGDGKRYQFRVKADANDYHSYIAYFTTSVDWQTVVIPKNELYPSFRGRKLDRPNFQGEQIIEIGFLIGNKKAENFNLMIDHIEVK